MSRKGFVLLDIDDSDERLIAYALNEGDVSDAELEPYWKRFDAAVDDGRKLRIYAEMHALPSFGDGLVLEKLKRLTAATSTIERMALVGDAKWLVAYAKTSSALMKINVRHFPMADKDAALSWVRK